jgi:hypothetical protein
LILISFAEHEASSASLAVAHKLPANTRQVMSSTRMRNVRYRCLEILEATPLAPADSWSLKLPHFTNSLMICHRTPGASATADDCTSSLVLISSAQNDTSALVPGDEATPAIHLIDEHFDRFSYFLIDERRTVR